LKTARDRALVFVLAYTAVRVGELLRDPNDPRRRGVRWEDISLDDGSMDVYRKKQQWDAASLPDPVISPLRSYRKLMEPPTERWPVFPTFDQPTLATLVEDGLADRGEHPDTIDERRDEYAGDLLLALDEDLRPPSITTDGARSLLRRLSNQPGIDVDLIVRTGGDERTSNFLPWHANGNEAAVYFCTPYWPEFSEIDFMRAIRTYEAREESWQQARTERAVALVRAVAETEVAEARQVAARLRDHLPVDDISVGLETVVDVERESPRESDSDPDTA